MRQVDRLPTEHIDGVGVTGRHRLVRQVRVEAPVSQPRGAKTGALRPGLVPASLARDTLSPPDDCDEAGEIDVEGGAGIAAELEVSGLRDA